MIKRGIRKILTFIKGSIAYKIFDKITLKPLYFRKALSSPRKTESIQILERRSDFISRDLRVLCTLDSLKRIYNAFRTKPSLGAPGLRHASFEKKALVRLMRKMSSFSGTSWSTSSVAWKCWFLWNKKNLNEQNFDGEANWSSVTFYAKESCDEHAV